MKRINGVVLGICLMIGVDWGSIVVGIIVVVIVIIKGGCCWG